MSCFSFEKKKEISMPLFNYTICNSKGGVHPLRPLHTVGLKFLTQKNYHWVKKIISIPKD